MTTCQTCPREVEGETLLCDECRVSAVALEARSGYYIDPAEVVGV